MEIVAAEAAVSFTVEKLREAVIRKVKFLRGVEGQLNGLKNELKRMYGFLRDASQKQASDERVSVWISDIRQVAQDVEDVIETFILQADTQRSRGLLKRSAYFPRHVYRLHKMEKELKSIQVRLQDIDKSCERYGIQNLGESGLVSTTRRSSGADQRRQLSPWQRDKHLVGLEEDVESLLRKVIFEEKGGLSVAAIEGMGGIGKSTLAREVYNHPGITRRFDQRAWVVVSDEFNPREVIKELVLQLVEPSEDKLRILEIMEKSPMEHLKSMLYERLKGKQYFIVLDDVWRQEAWESLAGAFPDEEDKASRLLITSRNKNVPRDAWYVHEMKTLDPKKSWKLFLNKAFIDGKCPEELEDIGKEIVSKCGGLPLAVVMVGGLLLEQRESKSGWVRVLKGMNSHLGRSKNNISAILELSYHDLPPHLKSCFLCLGFFKEDATIRAEKLIQVWIAEGLIPQAGDDNQETMEEIGTSCLYELINRNMVQVKDISLDGRVKNCNIHDLLRELSIKKAKEEISFEILKEGINLCSLDKSSRHCAIYCSTERFISSSNPRNNHLRSLFFHGAGNIDDGPSYNWKNFGLLRVLDFEGFGLRKLPDSIITLIGLRYLGLRDNKIQELPSSLGRLKNLEVLDIARNLFLRVPNVIRKMESLRHLYVSYLRHDVHLKIDSLKNLQTVMYLSANNWMVEHPTQMNSLRKLGIYVNEHTDLSKLWTSLDMLENLMCLKLKVSFDFLPSLDSLVCLHSLTQLKVDAIITGLPHASNFPPNLSYLTLVNTLLDEDPMPVLEMLPKLMYLKLERRAYEGEKMAISHDGFPKLKVLSLRSLLFMESIKLEKGGMPELKQVEIHRCQRLRSLPEELRLKLIP